MRGCGVSMRRAFASFNRLKSTSTGGTVEERSFRKEVEEVVVNRMMASASSSSISTEQPDKPPRVYSTQQTVVPVSLKHGEHESSTSQGHLPLPQKQPVKDEQQPVVFEKGVFESLKQQNDIFKRPGFDRLVSTQLMNDIWLVGVIDGHGQSPICAEYLAESFPVVVRLLLERPRPPENHHHHLNFPMHLYSHHHQQQQHQSAPHGEKPTEGPHDLNSVTSSYYCEILKEAFKICSREWDSSPQIKSSEHYRSSGAVALLALVSTSSQQIYMASAGDCRALVSQTTGRGYRFVHSAHRTDNVKERLRVLQQGGRIRNIHGVLRVNGSLIPTRVFGDVGLKIDFFGRLRNFLDPDPEIATVEVPRTTRTATNNKCAFSVLASDGLWDSITTESVVEICTEALGKNKTAEEIAQLLGSAAMQSTDDDVAIIVLVW